MHIYLFYFIYLLIYLNYLQTTTNLVVLKKLKGVNIIYEIKVNLLH